MKIIESKSKVAGEPSREEVPPAVLHELFAQPQLMQVIAVVMPMMFPGVRLFFTKLEYELFPPGTTRNSELRFFIVEWNEMTFMIGTFPTLDLERAEVLGTEKQVNIALDRGKTVLSIGGPEDGMFPFTGPNAYMLRMAETHPLKNVQPLFYLPFFARETKLCEQIENDYQLHHVQSRN